MDNRYEIKKDRLIFQMPKEVDQHESVGLCKELDFLIDSYGIRRLVFDFSDTEFMDSSGIGVIIGRSRNIGFFGGKTYAVNLNHQIQKIFKASGLQKLVLTEGEVPDGEE